MVEVTHLATAQELAFEADDPNADLGAIAHALIDIAESLRALRAPALDPNTRSFGGQVVHTVQNLDDLPLEHVGGDDE